MHFFNPLNQRHEPDDIGRGFRDINELLIQRGIRSEIPSEETRDVRQLLSYPGEFERVRFTGGSSDVPTHGAGMTTHARVFANSIAEPYMKSEKLRFPVGSMIAREKLLRPHESPELVAAMIKRERGFDRANNDWEFVVVDKEFSRVKRGNDVKSCAVCHANARASDMVYKSYLTPE